MDMKWYCGSNPETFSGGPYYTREDAILELDGEAGYIVSASKPNLQVSEHLNFDQALEEMEEDFDRMEDDKDVIFDMSKAQQADLIDRLKATCRQWQLDHALVFTSYAFGCSTEPEFISHDV